MQACLTDSRRRRRGSSVVELTMLVPWILFVVVGVVDTGFFFYDMIAVENAARVAAEYASQSTALAGDTDAACTKVRADMAQVPGVSGLANCNSAPLVVTAASVIGPDSQQATSVTVTYHTSGFIPIPGLLKGALNVTSNVKMRVKP
jgi:Flp pilus assembly protein TadG